VDNIKLDLNWTVWAGLGCGPVRCSCEHGKKYSGFVKWEYLE